MLRLFNTAIRVLPTNARSRLAGALVDLASDEWRLARGIPTMFGSVENLRRNGFNPTDIVDIGAYRGEWTRQVAEIYPDARFWLFEPQPSKKEELELAKTTIRAQIQVFNVLLGAQPHDGITFHLRETGSSVLKETTSFEKTPIQLPMQTLDLLFENEEFHGPLFLKLDVQGYELEVLKGSERTLAATEVALLEVSLLEYNEGAPIFSEVIDFMHQRNFAIYDICGQLRRESDGALFQVDLIFTKTDSNLRARRKFWLRES